MVSKSGRTTDFTKEEELLMAAFRENFQKQKCKGYDNKTLQIFNSQNL